MARPKGTKVINCTNPDCNGKIVVVPGGTGTCSKCGAKVKLTQKLAKELGKA